jgi:predicted esterase
MKNMLKVILISTVLFLTAACFFKGQPRQIEDPEFLLYVPSGIEAAQKCPLVVALSPGGDAQAMLSAWKNTAEKYKLVIFASKSFRNGVDMNVALAHVYAAMRRTFPNSPIDTSKIIITGFSGGGMGAHAFSFLFPNSTSAVIINTGMINEYYLEKRERYPRKKLAVFLASPSDFRYDEMEHDRNFLESLGWKTKWIKFAGGHTLAPDSAYREAAKWVLEQFRSAPK